MLDTPCFEVVWKVLATHSIRQFPLHLPSRASPYAITFQLDSTHGSYGYCDTSASAPSGARRGTRRSCIGHRQLALHIAAAGPPFISDFPLETSSGRRAAGEGSLNKCKMLP
jgi:hypothetical protein